MPVKQKIMASLSALVLWALVSDPAQAEWITAETAHFTVRADVDPDRIRQIARELEMLDAGLAALTGVAPRPPGEEKLVFTLMDTVDHVRSLTKLPPGFGAVFQMNIHGNMALAGLTDPASKVPYDYRWPLYHEYAHYFIARNFPFGQPTWFHEGFASVAESASIVDRTSVAFGGIPPSRGWIRNEPTWIRLEDIFGYDLPNIKPEYFSHFYAEAWLTAHFMMIGKRREAEFGQYFSHIASGKPLSDPLSPFEGGSSALTNDMRAYARQRALATRTIAVPEVMDDAITVRTMRPEEIAMVELGLRLSHAKGFDELDTIFARLKELRMLYPEDKAIGLQLAWMAFDMGEFAFAREQIAELLKMQDPEPRVLALDGLLIMKNALDDAPASQFDRLLAKSRARIGEALERAPRDPFILLAMFRAYEADTVDVPEKGFAYLRRAIDAAPNDADLRNRLAEERARVGDPKGAADALRPLANLPHLTNEVSKARACLKFYEERAQTNVRNTNICIIVRKTG